MMTSRNAVTPAASTCWRSRTRSCAVAAVLTLCIWPATACAQEAAEAHHVRVSGWERDLDYLTAVLPKVHGNAFHTVSRARFDSAAASLRERLPSLDGPVVRAELAALVALVSDGHTRVNLLAPGGPGVPAQRDSGFVPLPIRPYWFADGLFVRSARETEADLLGARIVRIGNAPIEQVLSRLQPYTHRDNAMTLRLLVPILLTRPAFLVAAGVIDSPAEVPVELVTRDGRPLKRVLRPQTDAEATGAGPWIDAADAAGSELPLWRQRNDENYWFATVDGGRTLYLQFNSVRDAEDENLTAFAARLGQFLEANAVERLVLDLRNNDGGNWVLAVPLIDVLDAARVNRRGRLFVVVGRATFSAAGSVAALIEDRTEAVFVGEPTGARPNAWGDMDVFTLPGSGLSVSYSERFFQSGGPYDDRPWVAPEVTAEATYGDYEAGRDPALEAIANYESEPPLREQMMAALGNGGVEAALSAYDDFTDRPRRRYYWAHDDLSDLGIHLWLTDRVAASIPVWERMAADYPASAEGYENLAETYAALEDRGQALEALRAALTIDPDNGDALEVLEELCDHEAVAAFVGLEAEADMACGLPEWRRGPGNAP